MGLAERLIRALEVLSSDEQAGESLREQAASYIGEPVDDASLSYLDRSADVVYNTTFRQAQKHDFDPKEAHLAAICNVLISGIALGKRLGIEDGERFAREVENVD